MEESKKVDKKCPVEVNKKKYIAYSFAKKYKKKIRYLASAPAPMITAFFR